MVNFDPETLYALMCKMAQAADDYSTYYQDLTSLIENIEQGTLTGPCAVELKRLYDDKKGTFQKVEVFVESHKDQLHGLVNEGIQLIDDLMTNEYK